MLKDYLTSKVTAHHGDEYTYTDSDTYKGGTAVEQQIKDDRMIDVRREDGKTIHIPFKMVEKVEVDTEIREVQVDDPLCPPDIPIPPDPGEPYFTGVNNISVNQGVGVDLLEGVKAFDAEGNEIPFTVNPTAIAACDKGAHTVTYTAEGVEAQRVVTINSIANPTISGLTPLTVEANEEFDPLEGVSAVDGNGNTVEVTYEQPSVYPYQILTIRNVSPETGGLDSTKVTIDANPKAAHEVGEAVITNFVVEGNNLGTVTRRANTELNGTNATAIISTEDDIIGTVQIEWETDTGTVTQAFVMNESEHETPLFRWDSVVVTVTGERQ